MINDDSIIQTKKELEFNDPFIQTPLYTFISCFETYL